MTPSRARCAREQGFTLLELLVAITLLGMLMAALFGGLRLGARVWETGEARLDASAQVQIVQDFLRQRLAESLPLEAAPAEDGSSEPLFQGGIEALRFANVLPDYLGAGLYLMELALADAPEGKAGRNLVLRWRPLDLSATSSEDAATEPEERVLLEGIEGLELAYFGSPDPRLAPEWWPEWRGQSAFPGLVRVQVRFAADDPRSWPELIVHPMVDLALQF
jgi:general secretion pathway protein J